MRRPERWMLGVLTLLLGLHGGRALGQTPEPSGRPLRQPLLLVAGFSNARTGVAMDALRDGVAKGKIAVLAPLAQAAQQALGVEPKRKLPTLEAFLPEARKGGLLLVDLPHLSARYRALPVDGHDFFAAPSQYPLYTGAEGEPLPDFAGRMTRLVLTGVTAISRATGALADSQGIRTAYERVLPWFEGADLVHISNEVSLTPDCTYAAKTMQFCTKERDFAKVLQDLGVDAVELTGNHTRDFGKPPFLATLAWLKQHGYGKFGGGADPQDADAPLILTLKDGRRLGFLGYNEACPLKECADAPGEPGANRYRDDKAKAGIRRLRELKVDLVFVGVQFTERDSYAPLAEQRRIARFLIEQGADLVYGSQAHQIQQVEFHRGKPIFYGLGNFLFDQVHNTGVRQAFFLQHYLWEGRLVQTVPVFTFMSEHRRITPATAKEEAAIRAAIYKDDWIYAP